MQSKALNWPASPERAAAPTPSQLLKIRLLIVAALLALGNFLVWLVDPSRVGDAWLFWPLTVALLLKVLRWLHEWMYYARIAKPREELLRRAYTVDVFTTACPGEPREMIVGTLRAMCAIRYPHQNYLCDEGNDPDLKRVCEELGVHHVTRTHKRDAKAGNINNALRQSAGEICVVLDPDHEPSPYLLDRVLPYFGDERVGFVQSSQPYRNQSESLVARGAAEQTYHFYGPVMMGMHGSGTTQAIGANCVFRREALRSIGGHAAGLAEDMHTSMRLYAAGWKSVYVPESLTRGLVPATLGAYYKQQIKWSCGTFDLLFQVYPRLFRYFTPWQKLHYLLAPTFYLSGLVGLINIAVPIVCLLYGWVAWRVTLGELLAWYLPVIILAGLIRQSAQNFLVEPERERGFHIVGGLLAAGSWHIFLAGFLCAVFRVKIPYIPTPKGSEPEDAWKLATPNFVAAGLSLGAVVYGLSMDWTPYSLLMALFAAWNAAVLLFVAMLGQQRTLGHLRRQLRVFAVAPVAAASRAAAATSAAFTRALRGTAMWVMGRAALPSALVVVGGAVFVQFLFRGAFDDVLLDPSVRLLAQEKDVGGFYTGIYLPEADAGVLPASLDHIELKLGTGLGIVSLYQAWGPDSVAKFPDETLRGIHARGAVPMITWEPWSNLFPEHRGHPDLSRNRRIFEAVARGQFDPYLKAYAARVRDLGGPVLLRLAHEMDNPQYPWSSAGGNTPAEFRAAWRHIVNLFNAEGACNVGWVWSPWGTPSLDEYFPGQAYVDWVGLTTLNYGRAGVHGRWESFAEIYEPMRRLVIDYNRPVMLAEFGTTDFGGDRGAWFREALSSIGERYPEIKAAVFFHTDRDTNWVTPWRPPGGDAKRIDWTFLAGDRTTRMVHEGFSHPRLSSRGRSPATLARLSRPPEPPPARPAFVKGSPGRFELTVDGEPFYIRGVAYNPAHDWRDGNRPLTRRELEADLPMVRAMGANTIRRYGRGWYDRNIFNVSAEHGVKVLYGFWLEHEVDYVNDTQKLREYEDMVERTVLAYRDHPGLLGWTLGNEAWGLLKHHFGQPYLTHVRHAHVAFVEKLARRIHELDGRHPVFVVHEHTDQLGGALFDFARGAPSVDVTGVNSYYEPQIAALAETAARFDPARPYLVSEFGPDGYWHADFTARSPAGELHEASAREKAELYESRWRTHVEGHRGQNVGGIAYCWRDRYEATPTWFGLTDADGVPKPGYFALRHLWTGAPGPDQPPQIVQLAGEEPARFAPGSTIQVRATVNVPSGAPAAFKWSISGEGFDRNVGTVSPGRAGDAAVVTLPEKPGSYRVHVQVRANGGLDEATYPLVVSEPEKSGPPIAGRQAVPEGRAPPGRRRTASLLGG